MTFARPRILQTTHFSEGITVVKRSISLCLREDLFAIGTSPVLGIVHVASMNGFPVASAVPKHRDRDRMKQCYLQ